MTILFLTTSPAPQFADTDAVFQEIATLREAFAGVEISITPERTPAARYPRQLFGLHCLTDLWKAEAHTRVTQIFYPVLYCFPVLRWLRNPIVFTVTASVVRSRVPRGLRFLRKMHRVVVSNPRDEHKLREWELPRVDVIRPGLDLDRFAADVRARKRGSTKLADGSFHLLMASAPWAERQFDEKGVDALLGAVALAPHLSATILLRGLFESELRQRIGRLGIESRIRVVNEKVDVRDHLRAADAVILAARRPDIVKTYPHSLIEALAAGKPVIISREIPMADLVQDLGAGVVTDEIDAPAILAAAISIMENRYRYLAGVRRFNPAMFSISNLIDSYRKIYDDAAGAR